MAMENEGKLIRAAQGGDKAAFQSLIAGYYPYVSKFLHKLTGGGSEAEDMTQETFLKLIRNIERFDAQGKAAFATYLLTIAKNCYIDHLRKIRHDIIDLNSLVISSEESIELDSERRDEAESLLEAIDALPPEQALAVRLRHLEQRTLQEIAKETRCEPKTVKSRIHHGIVKLRKRMLTDN